MEEEMATHSSVLIWEIPWTEELVRDSPWGRKASDMTEWAHTIFPKVLCSIHRDMASASMLFFFLSWFLLGVISQWFISMFHLKEMPRPRSCTEWLSGNYQGNSFGVQKIQTYDIRFVWGLPRFDCHRVHAQSLRNAVLGPWARKKNLRWEKWLVWYLFIVGYILLIPALNSMAGNAVCGQGTGEFLKVISEGWLLESLKMGIKEGPFK